MVVPSENGATITCPPFEDGGGRRRGTCDFVWSAATYERAHEILGPEWLKRALPDENGGPPRCSRWQRAAAELTHEQPHAEFSSDWR